MSFRRFIFFPQCLMLVLSISSSVIAGEEPAFLVRFERTSVSISGRIDSEKSIQSLTAVVKGARPDLSISTESLIVDPASDFPQIADVKSLLAELGLSTHEGRLEIWPDRVLVGGLTDSLVTLTALKIRLEPMLKGRRFINHICIVGTEFLPKIAVSLSAGTATIEAVEMGKRPETQETFEAPGLLLEKLFPTLLMLSDFDRLEGKPREASSSLRAMPVKQVSGIGGGGGSIVATPLQPLPPAPPLQQYETLPSVRFSSNSFLLQANQGPIFDNLAKYLLTPDHKGRLVILETVRPSGGSAVFTEYLSERRGEEVKRFLAERGVDIRTLSAKIVDSPSPLDEGEVRIRIEIPLKPPATPATPAEEPDKATAPPQDPAD